MIKKLIGIVVAVAVIVIIVMTVARSGEYRSMLGSEGSGPVVVESSAMESSLPNGAVVLPGVVADSVEVVATDSVGLPE